MYELKIYRGVICHDNEEWCKIWRRIDLSFKNWHEEFGKFWSKHLNISKVCTFIGFFWTKYIMFELKRDREVMFHDTEEWFKIWRKPKLWFGKRHEKYNKFLSEYLKVSNLGLWWDPFIKSRKCMTLRFEEEWCVMAMKNDAKSEWKLTCRFKTDIRNLASSHRLRNSNFILKLKMPELNQNKNSKQPD